MGTKNKNWLKPVLVCGAVVLLLLGAGYAILRATGIVSPGACVSEDRGMVPNLFGAKLEVVYTNCDTLAKDESIRVYVSRATVKGESWFARKFNRRELILDYDPGTDERPPVIAASGDHRILISVPSASQVFAQRRGWRNVAIDYKFDRIVRP